MLNLPARIQKIIDMCPNVDMVADIGTDHGLTACGLLLQEKAKHVVATDISEPSLQKAKALSKKLSLENRMEFRIGNGLGVLRLGEVQGIVLSGMGAPLIIDILEADKEIAKSAMYITICAHNYPERIRAFCQETQYRIEKEDIVCENGRYYIVMRIAASEKGEVFTETELLTGKNMTQSGIYLQYLLQQIKTYAQIEKQVEHTSDTVRYSEVKTALRIYERAYREVGGGEGK